jgi:hypothetical protein
MTTSASRPRKKVAINVFSELNKAQLKQQFNVIWDSVKDSMQPQDRIRKWNEFVRDCWEKEAPEVRDKIVKQMEEENKKAFDEWKEGAKFKGTPEDLDK